MVASACLTLALGQGLVWCRRREARASALFAVLAFATALVAVVELWMMRSATTEEFGLALRWYHVPGWMVIVSLVGFVRLYLRAGRPWLAWAVCGVRTLSLILNFAFTPNLNYREITALRHIRFLGETVSVAEGVRNPWMLVGQTSFLLLGVFVVDAVLTVWRRGDRRQAQLLGSAIVFFVVAGAAQVALALWGVIDMPILTSLFFLGIVAAMGLEMSDSVLRALRLADDLHESEERMSLAAEAAGFGVWMWTIARNQIWASERWLRLFGFAPEDVVTFDNVIRRIHPEDREMVEREVLRAVTDGVGYVGEYRVDLPDGNQRWVVTRGRVYPDAHGKPCRMLGTAIDITQRKQSEAALKQSEERFRHVAETVGEFIWEVDAEGLYTYASPSVERILGYTPGELVGKKHFYDLFEPAVREELKAAAFAVFAARQAFRDFPNPNVSKSGKLVHLETTGTPVLDSAGKLVGYLGADTDVTARKKAELELVQQRNELAHIARVSMMGQLAASLAHELNQPLGAILRNAEAAELFLQEPSPDLDEVRAILADIRKDDQRAGAVIDGMRALIKRRDVEHCPLNLDQLAGEVVTLLGPDAELRRVGLSLQTDPALPPVQGDRVQLQQVLLNLLFNAMDAVNDNPPAKRLVAVRARPAGTTVEVTVSDNGSGIAADELSRVFEPFYTSKPNGLGMGLAISRSIIEAHGGRLWAENNPAGSATFTFTLPTAEGGRDQ
jgi:PAS domain S-box-containing protein